MLAAAVRRDLAGLTFVEFSAWCKNIIGYSEPFHRAVYRHLMATGRFEPGRAKFRPDAIELLRQQAETIQHQAVTEAREAFDADAGRTTKILTRLEDGLQVESVLIPMRLRAGEPSRHTACVSSQVGCKMGCTFCQTAKMGLKRNLSAHEIVGQLLAIRAHTGVTPRNVVFMGMGEPLDNIEAVAQAVAVMTDPAGLALAPRHITISTVGRVDGIARMAELGLARVNLAVSLTSTDDALRSRIMPVNRIYNLARLKQALLDFSGPEGLGGASPRNKGHCPDLSSKIAKRFERSGHRRKILISYVLMAGVNDSLDDARSLSAWLSGLEAQVNLIPLNRIDDSDLASSEQATIGAFRMALVDAGIPVRVRSTKGDSVMAACGQLGAPKAKRAS